MNICVSRIVGASMSTQVTHLCSAPHILVKFASHDSFGNCPCNLFDILFQREAVDVFKYLVAVVDANRLAYAFD